jgi:hypothetical protein
VSRDIPCVTRYVEGARKKFLGVAESVPEREHFRFFARPGACLGNLTIGAIILAVHGVVHISHRELVDSLIKNLAAYA